MAVRIKSITFDCADPCHLARFWSQLTGFSEDPGNGNAPGDPEALRVSPGHLVAIASAPDGTEVVVWRWYDAVVLGEEAGLIRLWEPAHGEILAQPRSMYQSSQPGTRACLSAGLPGADWWVAGGTAARAEDAGVELDEVGQFYTERELWNILQ